MNSKKFLGNFVIIAFLVVSIVNATQSDTPKDIPKSNKIANLKSSSLLSYLLEAGPLYMSQKLHKNWKRGIKPSKFEISKQRKLFGYNLGIEHIIDCHPHIVKAPNRITLYLHGWGDQRNSAKLCKTLDVLPGDIVTFNFPDSSILIPIVHRSSLGQLSDILPALYSLKWAKDNLDLESVDLFGYSRGGATAVNIIAVLADKTGKYDQELEKIGINNEERIQLLQLIQKGTIVLNCPLRDMNVTTQHFFNWINPNVPITILESMSKYKRNGLQAITSTDLFKGLNLKTLIHFQHNDTVVSNKQEADFYYRIARHNPQGTYLLLGNDGGHLHTQHTLSQAIHTFRKTYGAAYDSEYGHVTLSTTHPCNQNQPQLMQPYPYNIQYIEQIIRKYYAACIQQKK